MPGKYSLADAQPAAPQGQFSLTDAQPLPSAAQQVGTSLKNQGKALFDTLASIVDPEIGQRVAAGIVDAHVEQWHQAKKEYAEGNYANAARRALATAVPLFGPMIENTAQKLVTPGQQVEGITDIAAAPIASELGARVPAALGAAADAAAPVLGAAARMATSPVVRDVAGVVSPRAAHALAIADRMIKTGQKIREAINKPAEPTPAPPAGVNTNQPEALRTQPTQAPAGPAPTGTYRMADISQGNPVPVPPPSAAVQPAAAPVEPPPAAVQPETVPRGTQAAEPQQPAAPQPISRADSLKPETAKTLKVGDQRTMPDGSVQTLQRVPIQEIEGDAGNKIDQATVKRYQEKGYDLQPELKTNPEGGYTIFEGHHRILSDVRNGADTVVAWTPKAAEAAAEPVKPAAAGAETTQAKPEAAAPPQNFGEQSTGAKGGLPILPGHTKLTSSMAHSAGFDPQTGEPQIFFGASKGSPGGTLYRYPDLPPAEFQKALGSESFGAYFREHIRPKYKGVRVQVPEPNAPLLGGVDYDTVPSNGAQQTNAPGGKEASSGVGPAVQKPTGAKPESVHGNETNVLIPGENTSYPARYKVVELSDIQASHNGETFQANPKYQLKNDRDYSRIENQGKVVNNALPARFDPRFHITDNPDAANGPVVIDQNGNALGGNGRTMMLQRVYKSNPKGAEAYKTLLAQKAAQFGIDPAQLEGMKQPVLVREVTHDLASSDQAAAITNLNKVGTAALRPAERAIADSRRVSQGTLDSIAGKLEAAGPKATLGKVLEGQNGTEVLNQLIQDGVISDQERAGLANETALTKTGHERISKLLLGRFFKDPAQLDTISQPVRNKLERIAAPLASVEGSAEWNLTPKVQEALDLLEQARAHGKSSVDFFLKQDSLGAKPEFSADAVTLAKALQKNTTGGLLEAVKSYAEAANYAAKGETLFGNAPKPAEAFAEAFTKSRPVTPKADTLASVPKVISGKVLTKQEMIDRGADGSLSHGVEEMIPVKKIISREPTPAMEGGYKKGTPITQPIEVQYDPEQGYVLYSGNHRVTQAEINGQQIIPAFVEYPTFKEARAKAAQAKPK